MLLLVAAMPAGVASAQERFPSGHIFLIESGRGKACEGFDHGRIWDIDPLTREAKVFFELPFELCGGLVDLSFTPDGTRLRACSFLQSVVAEFRPTGEYEIILDRLDGLSASRALAHDGRGNFFVANNGAQNIVRFPPEGGAGTVVADSASGIWNIDGIAPTSDGSLYCASGVSPKRRATAILRISADGTVSVFDLFDSITVALDSVADHAGNLYALAGGPTLGPSSVVLRYRIGDADSRESLILGVLLGPYSELALSPDEKVAYATDYLGAIHALNLVHESETVLIEPLAENAFFGMALVDYPLGDFDRDEDVDWVDYGRFRACVVGPVGNASELCRFEDLDRDQDVDLFDFSVLQRGFTGEEKRLHRPIEKE